MEQNFGPHVEQKVVPDEGLTYQDGGRNIRRQIHLSNTDVMSSYPVTELQLAILNVLWEEGEASVLEIHDCLREDRRVAQSTIATLLTRLEDRGFLRHREEGRRYIYRAAVQREELRRSMTAEFLEHTRPLFRNDLGLLVSHLLSEGDVSPEDLEEARALIADMERTAAGDES